MRLPLLLVAATLLAAAAASGQAAEPATPEALVVAAKRAAGQDYAGTFLRICVAPDNLNAGGPRPPATLAARVVPDRATLVRAAVQGVRQPLLRRHADPFFVGADDERRASS